MQNITTFADDNVTNDEKQFVQTSNNDSTNQNRADSENF